LVACGRRLIRADAGILDHSSLSCYIRFDHGRELFGCIDHGFHPALNSVHTFMDRNCPMKRSQGRFPATRHAAVAEYDFEPTALIASVVTPPAD
jgi:hypothetical protein